MTIREMREKRADLWNNMKVLHEKALAEKRDMTAEEKQQWDAMDVQMIALKETIDRAEHLEAMGAELGTAQPTQAAGREQPGQQQPDKSEYRAAFWQWVRHGMDGVEPQQRLALRNRFSQAPQELRAMGVAVPTGGGFGVADEDMAPIMNAMKFYGGMRQAGCTILTTATGADLPVPTADDTGNTGEQLGENTTVSEQDITIGQKILRAYIYSSKLIRVSYALLQDAAFDVEGWLNQRLGERLGRITNTKFTTGSGAATPEGVVTGSTYCGTTTASATAITWAELVDLELSVDRAYRQNARYMFNDTTLKGLKQLVDGVSRPIWVPGTALREPDTINGYPYVINSDMASPIASAKAVLFGDFQYYWIRDVQDITLIRLTERYADYLQVGFMAFSRHDGQLIDAGQHPIKHLLQHA